MNSPCVCVLSLFPSIDQCLMYSTLAATRLKARIQASATKETISQEEVNSCIIRFTYYCTI